MSTTPLRPFPEPDAVLTPDLAVRAVADVTPKIAARLTALRFQEADTLDTIQTAVVQFVQQYLGRPVRNPPGLLWVIALRAARRSRCSRHRDCLQLDHAAAVPDPRPPAWSGNEEREHLRALAEAALGQCPPAVADVARMALGGRTIRDIALALLDEEGGDPDPAALARLEHRVRAYLSRFSAIARKAA